MAKIGVQIELEGAPQYVENMKNLTAQTKLYQAQMKRLTTELSGASAFTKSITMSKALGQQLEALTNKSKLLEEEIAKEVEKNGELSNRAIQLKTQYENLQNEIAKVNQQLKEQGGLAGAVGAQFEEIGSKISSVGDKLNTVGESLTKGVTAPIAALGTASIAAFNEVDGAMDTLITKTGATGDALKGMEDIVNNIATSIPTSFDTAANAVGEVNTRFGLTGSALEELSKQFVEFAEINNTDVSSSIDSVQKALSAYGLSADEAGALLDRLNKVGQDTGISVEKVASGLVSNATAFQEMGLSIDEAATFMGQLEKSGANSESVLGGLTKALKKATEEGKPLDQALSELQSTVENGTGSMDGLSAAYDLFGKSAPQVYQAIKEGALNFEDLANSMESASGSVSDTFEATLDPVDEFQTHLNELKVIGADVANSMMPTITKAMEIFGETIKKLSDAWNSLSEGQQETIVKIAGVVAIIGPALAILGKVVSAIGAISSAIGGFVSFLPAIGAAVSAVGGVLTATVLPAIGALVAAIVPFLPIIAAVAAAIAAVVLVVKNWGDITDWISEKWNIFTEFIKNAVAGIGETFSNIWEKINTTIAQAKFKILMTIAKMIVSIGEKFAELGNMALQWGKDMIQNFIDGILAKWEALKQTVANVAQTVRDFLGFSEPSQGAMKNFNTWPKHMMEQYAHGIENMRFLVQAAVSDVASDVAVLENPIDSAEIYEAVRTGASNATVKIAIGEREFGRTLRDMGVTFDG